MHANRPVEKFSNTHMLEARLFEGSGGGADLGDDVLAFTALVEHALDAGQLAADAVQPLGCRR